ncbi:MAG: putative lipid II flippase FtsW [Candidatus Muiribacterium halophilum]|uniref:Probable peptidoglycan glycosyltransferase FtsW n=1 Tax=Muiribacterium halophilum TaxID=2053465 RepID=A0A2N5ZJZ8_MUIH1|nr:MAG: putative lipid II flippase FtsW [Candidatus Muirbacterium halophilum]
MKKKKKNIDLFFITVIFLLLIFGLVMVYSSSFVEAGEKFSDEGFFLKRQVLWAVVGMMAMFIVSTIDYHFFIRHSRKFLVFFLILLFIVLMLPESYRVKGANRWLSFKYFKIQPSEFIKYVFVWFLAWYFGKSENIVNIGKRIVAPILVFVVIALTILVQPDLGTVFVIAFTFFTILFVLGLSYRYLFSIMFTGIVAFVGAVLVEPYRKNRILAFLNPWAYRYNYGYHIINSLMAVGSGGFLGQGLGLGKQKFMYLPEPYSDFIFAVLCEETGFIGAAAVILLFLILFLRGWYLIKRAPDLSGFILGLGILTTITNQALINMGVVLNMFPTKGLPLPFISYGGSSLLIIFINVGIILNISRYRHETTKD